MPIFWAHTSGGRCFFILEVALRALGVAKVCVGRGTWSDLVGFGSDLVGFGRTGLDASRPATLAFSLQTLDFISPPDPQHPQQLGKYETKVVCVKFSKLVMEHWINCLAAAAGHPKTG
jgi:hypothetical protein